MQEIWKQYLDTQYEVSNLGRIRNLYGKHIMRQALNDNGYLTFSFRHDGKHKGILVHRMVAIAFIENPENKPQVDHIDRIRTHNSVDNLRWVTRSENMKNTNNSLVTVCQFNLDGELVKTFHNIKQVEDELGISRYYLLRCCCGDIDNLGGFRFTLKN